LAEQVPSVGDDGLTSALKRINHHLRTLEEENERLKRIIARLSLEIEVKDELLENDLFLRIEEADNQSLSGKTMLVRLGYQ
jgi:hypothetical protein